MSPLNCLKQERQQERADAQAPGSSSRMGQDRLRVKLCSHTWKPSTTRITRTPENTTMALEHFKTSSKTNRPYISPSQVNRVLRCPANWYAYYIEGKRAPTSWNLHYGDVAHNTVAWAFERKLLGKEPSPEDLMDEAENISRQLVEDGELERLSPDDTPAPQSLTEDETAKELFSVGGELALDMWDWFPHDEWNVQHVEQSIFSDIYGFVEVKMDLHGFVDLEATNENGEVVVLDWKTTGRKPSSVKDNHMLQMYLYMLAKSLQGVDVEHLVVPYIVRYKTKDNLVKPLTLPAKNEAMHWAKNLCATAVNTILNDQFHANPISAGWFCNPKYCSHFADCHAAPTFL